MVINIEENTNRDKYTFMLLTIVICTHNRSALLIKTLDSLYKINHPEKVDINLLVIANACSDDTINLLQKFQHNLIKKPNIIPLQFSDEPEPGKSNALNKAISMINEGYLCFVDDDHRVDENYFSAIVTSINSYPAAQLFCGQIIPDWTGQEPEWIHEQGQYKIYPLPIPHFELGSQPLPVKHGMKIPGGGNLIVKRDVFTQVGTFSTELGPKGHNLSGSEDSDFILRVLKANIPIQYIPEIIQYHYVDEQRLQFNYLVRKSFQRTRSLIKAKHPDSQSVPLYLWRKLLIYTSLFLFAFNVQKLRFYAMRVAATLGEMIGLVESRNN